MNRYLAVAVLVAVCASKVMAQSGTNSPYSQFGLGVLSDQSAGFSRGMNGLGAGFHDGNQVNPLNPASYSSLDSLSFIFDAGVMGQITRFEEGARRLNAKNAGFEYVVAGFRVFRRVGVSFGLIPYSNIGYSYVTTKPAGDADNTVATNSYSGKGGLHQAYLGVGWQPFEGFSIGLNGSYLYGDYTRTLLNSFSDGYANTLSKVYTAEVRSYKLDLGVQYMARISKKDELTFGVAYGMGHKIGGNPKMEVVSTNSQTGVADTMSYAGDDRNPLALSIPSTVTAGLMYNHANRLKLGFDYSLQKWASVEMPAYLTADDGKASYAMQKGLCQNRHKFTIGAEWWPGMSGRNLARRVRYRAGMSYATPYYYINGHDGPQELSATIGLGIPIMNGYNNRSILNVSAQWVRQSARNFITENTFRINIGLTFNERWFAKWKVG